MKIDVNFSRFFETALGVNTALQKSTSVISSVLPHIKSLFISEFIEPANMRSVST